MKTETFMSQLRRDVEDICKENDWTFDNAKQRGMAFETWCFNIFKNSYNESENRLNDCVIRTNDFQIDICFPSKEFAIYFIQSKYKKIAGKDPIDYSEVNAFLTRMNIFQDIRILIPKN